MCACHSLHTAHPLLPPASAVSIRLSSAFVSPLLLCRRAIVQAPRHGQLFTTPWTTARQASLSFTISWNLPKFMSIASVIHLILCRSFLLLPSIFPNVRVFSNKSAVRIRWPKYWSFSFSISPYNKYSGLISFRIDWLDLLTVQGTLKSPLQHILKTSVLKKKKNENISSSGLSFLYGSTFTSIHDYGQNHSFDYMDLCQQSTVSAF